MAYGDGDWIRALQDETFGLRQTLARVRASKSIMESALKSLQLLGHNHQGPAPASPDAVCPVCTVADAWAKIAGRELAEAARRRKQAAKAREEVKRKEAVRALQEVSRRAFRPPVVRE